jgi:MYXO-CTERM domain-containing protein
LAWTLLVPACGLPKQEPDNPYGALQDAQKKYGKVSSAIINGKADNAYPAAGTLTADKTSFCSGTLIAPRLFLTAAHCVEAFNNEAKGKLIEVRFDIPRDNSGYDKAYVAVDLTESKMHPGYKGKQNPPITDDIAVVVLKKPFFGVAPMPFLRTKMDATWKGRKIFFMGYGRLSSSTQTPAPRKYSTSIPIIAVDADARTNQPKNNTFAYEDKNTSVCQGDSGGPAFYRVNGVMTVLGVTSHGSAFNCVGPAYSFRTDPYVSWIDAFFTKFSTCKADADCGACGSCSSGKCSPKSIAATAKHCKVCKSDADCAGGACVKVGTGFRCQQPCDGSGCCPVGATCSKRSGLKSYCVQNTIACPPIVCKADTDCSKGEFCNKGVCDIKLPDREKRLCQPCASTSDCGKDGYCDTPDGRGGRCLQPCDSSDLCPKGFKCTQVAAGLKFCKPENKVCRYPCTKDSDCSAGYKCSSNYCKRPNGAQAGEVCASDIPCATGLNCEEGDAGGRCVQYCGFPPGSAGQPCIGGTRCNAGLVCYPNPLGGSPVCLESCAGGQKCKGGGQCLGFGINICTCNSDAACGSGRTCNKVIQGFGACTGGKAAPCPSGETCVSNIGKNSICVKQGGGNRGPGQSCSQTQLCRKGLTCAPVLNICIEDCTQSGKCNNGGTCQSLPIPGSTDKFCTCGGQNPATCASGFVCKVVAQGIGYCAADDTKGCTSDDVCPKGFICKDKKCVQGERPKEPTPEKPPVDAGPDAGPSEKPTGNEPTPDTKPADQTTKDQGSTGDKGSGGLKEVTPPSDGCKCSVNSSPAPAHGLWALFFLLLPLAQRRRRK